MRETDSRYVYVCTRQFHYLVPSDDDLTLLYSSTYKPILRKLSVTVLNETALQSIKLPHPLIGLTAVALWKFGARLSPDLRSVLDAFLAESGILRLILDCPSGPDDAYVIEGIGLASSQIEGTIREHTANRTATTLVELLRNIQARID